MVYIYETNQNLGGYNGLYRQRYDLGSSQPWGTQIFWPPVTGDLHHLKRSGGCYTFTMKHSTIQDPLPNSQKHPRATCSRCPNCRQLTFSPPRNAMIPGISKLFSGFLLQPWGVATRSVERPLGNCPKYITRRRLRRTGQNLGGVTAGEAQQYQQLSSEDAALLEKTDWMGWKMRNMGKTSGD